jgi:hypothetical protein
MIRAEVERKMMEGACGGESQRRRKRQAYEQADMVDIPAQVVYIALDASLSSFTEENHRKPSFLLIYSKFISFAQAGPRPNQPFSAKQWPKTVSFPFYLIYFTVYCSFILWTAVPEHKSIVIVIVHLVLYLHVYDIKTISYVS